MILEEERATAAPKCSVGHDRDAVSEQISFVHEVRGQHDHTSLAVLPDQVPRKPSAVLFVAVFDSMIQTRLQWFVLYILGKSRDCPRSVRIPRVRDKVDSERETLWGIGLISLQQQRKSSHAHRKHRITLGDPKARKRVSGKTRKRNHR